MLLSKGQIPARVRFISAEPLIEAVDLKDVFLKYEFHWCIIGGESGNKTGKYLFRECNLDWIEDIMADCKKHQVPVFVKQLGTSLAQVLSLHDRHGGDISEWDSSLQVREFPKVKTVNKEAIIVTE